MSADELREKFLSFFEERGHRRVASSSLVPEGDPSLMFTNSGMVQFKNVFTGLERRDYTRAVSAQKCLRAGGKHNDLENVGYTKRHHTLFEMLGNFSFGDYFKEEAIKYAWSFLVDELKLDKNKLTATVYHTDDEAFNLWKKFLPENKILKISTSDNFWQMGDSGPCGPCSEIFYDNGEKDIIEVDNGKNIEIDGVEIWNLVFMQYDSQNGKEILLPEPCVDTGMGLERMLAVLEGKRDNYDTSLFAPIVKTILSSLELKESSFDEGSEQRSSIKVIADHVRACAFMLSDDIVLSNEGRGYVLRRILRRAMRHIHKIDKRDPIFRETPVFYEIVKDTIPLLTDAFPELKLKSRAIVRTIENEEERFYIRLGRGLRLLQKKIGENTKGGKNSKNKIFEGEDAFMLYDTYGFPLDLTEDALRERGIEVDRAGFEKAMEQQKMRGRAAWVGSGEKVDAVVWFSLAERLKTKTFFCGYKDDKDDKGNKKDSISKIEIEAIVKNGEVVEILRKGEKGILIFAATPFYAESGGQRGDCGYAISSTEKSKFFVTDTQYAHNKHFILHHGHIEEGELAVGNEVRLAIDHSHRRPMEVHHSATHLLHAALRQVLGAHVQQRGSQIAPEKMRFDFNHDAPLTEEDKKKIESFINARCLEALPIRIEDDILRKKAEEAGAIALFGEKYDEKVRVVTIGKINSKPVSVELCGGMHVKITSEIGIFHIVSESSVGSGIRRIEAVAGNALVNFFKDAEQKNQQEIESLREQNIKLQAEIKHARESSLIAKSAKSDSNMVRNLGTLPPKDLKPLADKILRQQNIPAIALAAQHEGKVSLLLALSPKTAQQHSAVQLLKPAQKTLQAKGGGKPSLAQIGSALTEKLPQALQQLAKSLDKI